MLSAPRLLALVALPLSLLLGLDLIGCGSASQPHAVTSPSAGSRTPVVPTGKTPTTTQSDWLTYHGDASRSGQGPSVASAWQSLTSAWHSDPLDADIYAEPLYFNGHVVVATENNSVYSIDGATGKARWRTNLGKPVDGRSLPCGNINPSGITGTPVIDPQSGLIYVVAFVDPGHHELAAIDSTTGDIRFRLPIDPPGADPRVEQQRAALALGKDLVYVAYGGLFGDCGPYFGWVVGVRKDGSGPLLDYKVAVSREAGIWAPSGPSLDAAGFLYVATGNSDTTTAPDEGDSVLRLSPDLKRTDSFTAADWADLNRHDIDLGSMSPVLTGPGVLFQIGKAGLGYVLRADHLGGVGGQAFAAPVCAGGAYGGAAFSGAAIYVPCRDGLAAVRINADSSSFAVAWRGPRFNAGPPILAGGLVWTVDIGSGVLYGLTVVSGEQRFQQKIGAVAHFTTPSFGDGNILVAAGPQIFAFRGE